MDDSLKLWSSVGSAGIVDVADLGKIVFEESVVKLQGREEPVEEPVISTSALPAALFQQTSAVIRYGVTAIDGVFQHDPLAPLTYGLRLRYRDGPGRVVAKFIQVEIATGSETLLVNFDRHSGNFRFQVDFELGADTSDLDFVFNAYYVELTLSAKEPTDRPLISPPAVSIVQLFLDAF